MEAVLERHRPEIAALCRHHGITRLEVFGSAASVGFDPSRSDYDFLVDMDTESGTSPARRWIEFGRALESMLGRPVDLVSLRAIRNPYFAEEVRRTRQLVYERSPAQASV